MVMYLETYNGPRSYETGGCKFSSRFLQRIDRAIEVGPTSLGLTCKVVSLSGEGNTFRVQFFYPQDTDDEKTEIEHSRDLSSHGFFILEEGIPKRLSAVAKFVERWKSCVLFQIFL